MSDHEKWLPYLERMCDSLPAQKWQVFPVAAGDTETVTSHEFRAAVFRHHPSEETA